MALSIIGYRQWNILNNRRCLVIRLKMGAVYFYILNDFTSRRPSVGVGKHVDRHQLLRLRPATRAEVGVPIPPSSAPPHPPASPLSLLYPFIPPAGRKEIGGRWKMTTGRWPLAAPARRLDFLRPPERCVIEAWRRKCFHSEVQYGPPSGTFISVNSLGPCYHGCCNAHGHVFIKCCSIIVQGV